MIANWGLGSVSGLPNNPFLQYGQYGSAPQVIQLLQSVPQQLQQLQQLDFVRQQQLQYIQQLIQHVAHQLQYVSQNSPQQGFTSPISTQGVGQPFQTFGTGFRPLFSTQPLHVM